MIKALLRFGISVALGIALALPFMQLSPRVSLPAHAEENDPEIFLDNGFSGATELGQDDLQSTIGSIINIALSFLGILTVVIMLLGGFKWMTAGGNDEKVSEAKRLMISGVIGIAIIMSSWAITSFVIASIENTGTK